MTPESAVKTLRRQARATKRVAALRQRRAAQGLVRLELYVHPDDQAAVKTLAKLLAQNRLADHRLEDHRGADDEGAKDQGPG